jgi:hypothetical protein
MGVVFNKVRVREKDEDENGSGGNLTNLKLVLSITSIKKLMYLSIHYLLHLLTPLLCRCQDR